MLLRHLSASPVQGGSPRPAFEVFLASQKNVASPFGIVLQITHSELAGELAAKLMPEAFRDLPEEVVEAAWKHDFGWQPSDAAQTGQMPTATPKPFPDMPDDELSSWRGSLALAETASPLTRVLIGRHFAALSNQPSPRHEEFARTDLPNLRKAEESLGHSEDDLRRWAGAVGFCDLLSLYLASGVMEPAIFPLAHPAAPEAKEARQVTLTWEDGQPRFSEPVIQPGAEFRVEAQRFAADTGEVGPLALKWVFAEAG